MIVSTRTPMPPATTDRALVWGGGSDGVTIWIIRPPQAVHFHAAPLAPEPIAISGWFPHCGHDSSRAKPVVVEGTAVLMGEPGSQPIEHAGQQCINRSGSMTRSSRRAQRGQFTGSAEANGTSWIASCPSNDSALPPRGLARPPPSSSYRARRPSVSGLLGSKRGSGRATSNGGVQPCNARHPDSHFRTHSNNGGRLLTGHPRDMLVACIISSI